MDSLVRKQFHQIQGRAVPQIDIRNDDVIPEGMKNREVVVDATKP